MTVLLGDPHLGREFKIGVPIERRGEREATQRRDFEASLASAKDQLHINVGDLFDSFAVSRDVILYAAQTYKAAAKENPGGHYVVLMGNHDGRREAGAVSGFDLFCEMVAGTRGITVVRDKAQLIEDVLLCPWHPFKTAEEIIAEAPKAIGPYRALVGHWDLQTFGGVAPHNLIPTKFLSPEMPVFTGHIHKKEVKVIDGITVNVVGSMQPYAHGEDNGEMYVTLGLEDLEDRRDELRNKVVRLILKPGETLDEPLDCLQFSYKRLAADEEETSEVALADFDFKAIFNECMGTNPLTEQVWRRYEEERNAQQS